MSGETSSLIPYIIRIFVFEGLYIMYNALGVKNCLFEKAL